MFYNKQTAVAVDMKRKIGFSRRWVFGILGTRTSRWSSSSFMMRKGPSANTTTESGRGLPSFFPFPSIIQFRAAHTKEGEKDDNDAKEERITIDLVYKIDFMRVGWYMQIICAPTPDPILSWPFPSLMTISGFPHTPETRHSLSEWKEKWRQKDSSLN